GIVPPVFSQSQTNHWGPDMNEHKCDDEIRVKEITYPGPEKRCKKNNTFIQANEADIKAVCGTGGTPQRNNLFMSNQPFPVVKCTLQSGKRHPNCKYGKGKKSTRYIVLKCEEGLTLFTKLITTLLYFNF
uniref:Ribonuclease A-domain domain-containing protein n=1 Tax=Sinocyclocheilus rhinocerous TaxID=307959 RepID=A0A673L1Y8_9TELE